MESLTQASGWIGTLLIVGAYFLISSKKVTVDDWRYQMMNVFGALGVGVNVFHQQAWPAVALQAVWGIIAIVSLFKSRNR